MAGRDELLEHGRRGEPRIAESIAQHPHDAQADIEPDEVGQGQGAHRMVQPDPRPGVDVRRAAQPLLVGAHRLSQ